MRKLALVLASLGIFGCNAVDSSSQPPAAQSATKAVTANNKLEVEDLGNPPEHVSLLVLDGVADPAKLTEQIENRLKGVVYHSLAPRLLIVSVPDGAERVLQQLGVAARFDRALDPTEVPNATIEEQRFLRVFSNRYFPGQGPPKGKLAPTHCIATLGEPIEAGARTAPASTSPSALLKEAFQPSTTLTTPYASGTIVVSILLPESNGVAEPSTEDWTEDAIAETYLKIQTALEAIKRSEPNNDLRFILHYESSPGVGALPGTIDSDYEFGQHADFNNPQGEAEVSAPLLARLLGHPVAPEQVFESSWEYLNVLRARYHADGAFYIKVAANQNFTAFLRPHAYINGPWTTLSSDTPWQTFTHEFGHIFGALDEYCPDACIPTTALQGYLGFPNANATYVLGGDGIANGMGENQPSLMIGNDPNSINGYTRGAWGWLDRDGDGILEVRDTTPDTQLYATVTGKNVKLEGTVYDVPTKRLFGQFGISFNRIEAVEYQLEGDDTWFPLPVHQTTFDGPVAVELDLGAFPMGDHSVRVRSRNSVGNTDAPKTIDFVVGGPAAFSPPRVVVKAAPNTGSVRSAFVLTAHTADLDTNDRVQVRWDTNGDGVFDTGFANNASITLRPHTAGVYKVVAEARDRHGLTARDSIRLFVLDGNTSPIVRLADVPSLRHGVDAIAPTFTLDRLFDADGDALELNWIAELATADGKLRTETGFAAGNTSFTPTLPTPPTLKTTPVDLTGRDPSLANHTWSQSVALTPKIVATAAGPQGLVVTDLSDPAAPVLIAHLALETNADQLLLSGNTLYVLGAALTIVDVTRPRQPFEVKQAKAIKQTYTDVQAPREGVLDIPDGNEKGTALDHFLDHGERIDSVKLDVVVTHSTPAELRFQLEVWSGNEFTIYPLRDHVAGTGGTKTYTFSTATTPGIAPLVGQLASGQFTVRVADTVAGGGIGTLNQSTLTVKTTSRAFPVIEGKKTLAGTLPGSYVVLAGTGVQTIDASTRDKLKQVSLLASTPAMSAAVSGSHALVFAPLTLPPPKGDEGGGKLLDPAAAPAPSLAHGLFAVDLANPKKPKVVRTDESYGEDAGTLAIFGSRVYLTPLGRESSNFTQVGSVAAFVGGQSYLLGTLPTIVGEQSFGNDQRIWSASTGHVQQIDVSNPANARVLSDYAKPYVATMARLSGLNVLVYDGLQSSLANLNDVQNQTSRTYRITVQARDNRGGLSSETRNVQIIPYDHVPALSAVQTGGVRVGDVFTFNATTVDPDAGVTWDPYVFTRADLDGDGLFETDWIQSGGRDGAVATFESQYATPGARTVRFQTRDTFWGVTETALTFDVAE